MFALASSLQPCIAPFVDVLLWLFHFYDSKLFNADAQIRCQAINLLLLSSWKLYFCDHITSVRCQVTWASFHKYIWRQPSVTVFAKSGQPFQFLFELICLAKTDKLWIRYVKKWDFFSSGYSVRNTQKWFIINYTDREVRVCHAHCTTIIFRLLLIALKMSPALGKIDT